MWVTFNGWLVFWEFLMTSCDVYQVLENNRRTDDRIMNNDISRFGYNYNWIYNKKKCAWKDQKMHWMRGLVSRMKHIWILQVHL